MALYPKFYTCTKCGKSFVRMEGGIIANPADLIFAQNPICSICKMKDIKEKLTNRFPVK